MLTHAVANTFEELGLGPRPAESCREDVWKYTTLADPPPLHPDAQRWEAHQWRAEGTLEGMGRDRQTTSKMYADYANAFNGLLDRCGDAEH